MGTETIPVESGFSTIQQPCIVVSLCMHYTTAEGTCHSFRSPGTTLSDRQSESAVLGEATVAVRAAAEQSSNTAWKIPERSKVWVSDYYYIYFKWSYQKFVGLLSSCQENDVSFPRVSFLICIIQFLDLDSSCSNEKKESFWVLFNHQRCTYHNLLGFRSWVALPFNAVVKAHICSPRNACTTWPSLTTQVGNIWGWHMERGFNFNLRSLNK